MKTYLPLMTWVEARDAARAGRVALVPVGTTDANGPQLPTGFDHLVAAALAEQAAERTGGVWLPPIAFGVSEALAGFPGTVSVSPQLLGAQIEAVLGSLIAGGFEHVILINNHGPNQYPAEYACREVRRRTGVLVATINPAQLARDLWADLFPGAEIGHGAEPGTSLLMHLHPGAVRTDLVRPRPKNDFQGLDVLSPTEVRFGASRVNLFLELSEVSETAGWHNPESASADRGAALFGRMLDYTAEFAAHFRTMDTRAVAPDPVADLVG